MYKFPFPCLWFTIPTVPVIRLSIHVAREICVWSATRYSAVCIWMKLGVTGKVFSGRRSPKSELRVGRFNRVVPSGGCSNFYSQTQFRQHCYEIMNLWTIIRLMTRRVQSWRGNGVLLSISVKSSKIKAIITLLQLQPSTSFSWMPRFTNKV